MVTTVLVSLYYDLVMTHSLIHHSWSRREILDSRRPNPKPDHKSSMMHSAILAQVWTYVQGNICQFIMWSFVQGNVRQTILHSRGQQSNIRPTNPYEQPQSMCHPLSVSPPLDTKCISYQWLNIEWHRLMGLESSCNIPKF